jgi:hypothetical protein
MSSSITRTRIKSLLSAPGHDRGRRCGIGESGLQRRQHQLQPGPLGGIAQPPQPGDRVVVACATAEGGEHPAARDVEVGPGQRLWARVALERGSIALSGSPLAGVQGRLDRLVIEP